MKSNRVKIRENVPLAAVWRVFHTRIFFGLNCAPFVRYIFTVFKQIFIFNAGPTVVPDKKCF